MYYEIVLNKMWITHLKIISFSWHKAVQVIPVNFYM